MDLLETRIAEKERECAELAQKLHAATIGLITLKIEATLRDGRPKDGRGRKRWAIAKDYRRLLQAIIHAGHLPMTLGQMIWLSKHTGLALDPTQLRARVHAYVRRGIFQLDRERHEYTLTEAAIRHFSDSTASPAPSTSGTHSLPSPATGSEPLFRLR